MTIFRMFRAWFAGVTVGSLGVAIREWLHGDSMSSVIATAVFVVNALCVLHAHRAIHRSSSAPSSRCIEDEDEQTVDGRHDDTV